MPTPDSHFIIAGAQRSGTSYLVRLLDLHPAIDFAQPLRPEPKFFLRAGAEHATLEDYARLFTAGPSETRLRGEKSTSYLEREEAPRRIRRLLPDALLVFVLRDPVERAISNYWFSVQNGVETADMEKAFRAEPERREPFDRRRFSVSPFAYLARGDYERNLRRFEDQFPRDQITLLLFEDLIAAPARTVRRLVARFGIEWHGISPASRAPVNATPRTGKGPDEDLRRFLARHFAEPSRRLAERYGLDLSRWQGAPERPDGLPSAALGGLDEEESPTPGDEQTPNP